jgi:hypothetical protein
MFEPAAESRVRSSNEKPVLVHHAGAGTIGDPLAFSPISSIQSLPDAAESSRWRPAVTVISRTAIVSGCTPALRQTTTDDGLGRKTAPR